MLLGDWVTFGFWSPSPSSPSFSSQLCLPGETQDCRPLASTFQMERYWKGFGVRTPNLGRKVEKYDLETA